MDTVTGICPEEPRQVWDSKVDAGPEKPHTLVEAPMPVVPSGMGAHVSMPTPLVRVPTSASLALPTQDRLPGGLQFVQAADRCRVGRFVQHAGIGQRLVAD